MGFWSTDDRAAYGPEGREAEAGSGPDDLLLGPGVELEGRLTFAGTVRIDARFKGSIVTNDVLVVGNRARLDADIDCGTVVVYGEVNGNIRATTAVELHLPAKVRGDVETPSLSIEKGVVFEGRSSIGPARDARAEAPRTAGNGVHDAGGPSLLA